MTARTELETPIELGTAAAAAGMALSEEAGWNQTEDDWTLMIRLGRAFGVPNSDGRLVATALALPYPPRFGWISMVLVHAPYRRRGLATRLLETSIEELQARGLVPFLDATPVGAAVYERLGFRAVETLTRWRGHGGGHAGTPSTGIDAAALRELDEVAFGADRTPVLADLLERGPAVALRSPGGAGYLLSRAGRTATQIGPVVARQPEAAVSMLGEALERLVGPVLIDVPDRETAVSEVLRSRGFVAERPYVRMALGRESGFGESTLVRAIAGPELG